MQFPPDAPDLLAGVGELLEENVLEAVPGHLQHPVRVAGHLVRLVERELRLGPEADAAEVALLAALLDVTADTDSDLADTSAGAAELNDELARLLRGSEDLDLEEKAWTALVDITRRDLAIAKPGHDAWEGR